MPQSRISVTVSGGVPLIRNTSKHLFGVCLFADTAQLWNGWVIAFEVMPVLTHIDFGQ